MIHTRPRQLDLSLKSRLSISPFFLPSSSSIRLPSRRTSLVPPSQRTTSELRDIYVSASPCLIEPLLKT